MEFNITFIMLLSNGTYMPISFVITQVELDMASQQGDCTTKQHCCFDTSMVTTVALQLVPSSVHGSNVHGRNYQVSCYL